MMNTTSQAFKSVTALFRIIGIIILIGCTPASPIFEALPTSTSVLATATSTESPLPSRTPFVPKAIIKIASHSPLSGNQAIFGTDILRGAQLAVDRLASPLAELGYQVKLVSFDDRNNMETALTNAAKIIVDPEILCVIGNYSPRITIRLSEMYHQVGLAVLAPSTTSTILTDRQYPEVNRVIGREDLQGIAGAQFAKAQGFTNVYIISQKDDYALRNAEYFRLEADQSGIQVLGMLITDVVHNPNMILKRMMAANPELVYYAGKADRTIPFIREARAAGYTGAFIGLDDLNNPPLLDLAGPELVEGGGLYYTLMAAPANFYAGAAKFIKTFEVRYDTKPLLFAARAYDAAGMCMKAIENASKAQGGEIPTRAEVVRAIRGLRKYTGITGTYTFNTEGDPKQMEYYVYKVVSGEAADWDQNYIIASYDVAPRR